MEDHSAQPWGRRGIFLTALVGCLLAYTLFQLTRRGQFDLTFEIAAPGPATVRLACDICPEADAQMAILAAQPAGVFETVRFRLPKGTISTLRLEYHAPPGAVIVRNVAIRGVRGFFRPLPAPEAAPSGAVLRLRPPFDYARAKVRERIPAIRNGGLFLLAAGVAIYLLRGLLGRCGARLAHVLRRANTKLEPLARRLSVSGFIQFDTGALWFYLACVAAFAACSLANLNGSSIGVYGEQQLGPASRYLLGAVRGIRSDEWAYFTPSVLHQSLRRDRFAYERTALGNHNIALLGNLPVRHFTTVFRPQFWSFFVLPADSAYSVFWQCKALILLTGVFTWILLITRSSLSAAMAALWYLFSPFTQWSYSWASLLPEMVGLLSLSLVLACFLLVGRNRAALAVASLALASCAVNFVLCGYPPHLIPLCWLAVFFLAGWGWAHREAILDPAGRGRRVLAVFGAAVLVALVGMAIYSDLRVTIQAEAHTIYPGQRSFPGGTNLSVTQLLTHLLGWTATENHHPSTMANICEGAGFFWLAPLALLLWRRLKLDRSQHPVLLALLGLFAFLAVWMAAPVPKEIGRWVGLDRVFSSRATPTLGLANAAIVALLMTALGAARPARSKSAWLIRGAVVFALLGGLLLFTNRLIGNWATAPELLFNTALGTPILLCLWEGRKTALAVALVVSHVLLFGAVNPVQRGLDPIVKSELFRFVRQRPELLDGRWMVFDDAPHLSGFLSATGCEVYTGLNYLPDIDHFPLFASAGLDTDILNRNGYLTARLLPEGAKSRVELVNIGFVRWHVSPFDPLTGKLGIRYLAFGEKPPAEIAARLTPLSARPVSRMWLYRAY